MPPHPLASKQAPGCVPVTACAGCGTRATPPVAAAPHWLQVTGAVCLRPRSTRGLLSSVWTLPPSYPLELQIRDGTTGNISFPTQIRAQAGTGTEAIVGAACDALAVTLQLNVQLKACKPEANGVSRRGKDGKVRACEIVPFWEAGDAVALQRQTLQAWQRLYCRRNLQEGGLVPARTARLIDCSSN